MKIPAWMDGGGAPEVPRQCEEILAIDGCGGWESKFSSEMWPLGHICPCSRTWVSHTHAHMYMGGGEKGENTDDVGRDREGIGEERIEALLDPNT